MARSGDFSFAQVPLAKVQRSAFNRSHGYKTTFDGGYLIPFYVDEALPGDTIVMNVHMLGRLATPMKPVMDNMYLEAFFFSVPNRLLWSNWQKCMGERLNPGDSIDYLVPQASTPGGGFAELSMGDYFGIPTKVNGMVSPSALPFRAYNRVWNEWFRDENLQTRAAENVGDGPDNMADYVLRRRGKRHDYFTSCLPWPQKQTTDVMLPLGSSAVVKPVTGGYPSFMADDTHAFGTLTNVGAANPTNVQVANVTGVAGSTTLKWNPAASNFGTGLYADLTTATAATINALRLAFQTQQLLERDARGGTRYVELLKSHFGVVSPDFRLQRPEFLGGGSIRVNVNPVTQTQATAIAGGGAGTPATPQGNLSGFGVVAGRVGFTKSFTEHCTLLGLVMVRADLTYQQGLGKMWTRRTRYDFYWPAFAHLGEQVVTNREIYAQGDGNDGATFGYQERWSEYKYFPSVVTGQFRSNHATPLDSWHLAQKYTALPTLGATFIQEDPLIDRVIAVPSEPHFLLDCQFEQKHVRPMPTYSVPGLGSTF